MSKSAFAGIRLARGHPCNNRKRSRLLQPGYRRRCNASKRLSGGIAYMSWAKRISFPLRISSFPVRHHLATIYIPSAPSVCGRCGKRRLPNSSVRSLNRIALFAPTAAQHITMQEKEVTEQPPRTHPRRASIPR